MSYITANPDIDRLAGRAIAHGLSRSMQAPVITPPTMEPRFGEISSTPGYMVGEQLPGFVERHALLAPFGRYLSSMGTDNGGAAALGALAGGVAGAGLGYMRGQSPLLWGLGGAATGGLGSYLLSSTMKRRREEEQAGQSKQSSWYAMDAENSGSSEEMMDIQAKLSQDYAASSQVKSEILRVLQSLDPRELSRVHSLIRGVGGAGVVYAIARYLMGIGAGGSALLGLVGGGLSMMSGGNPVNTFGQRVDTRRNVFGQNRLV